MGRIRDYRDLVVWQEAMDFAVDVYRIAERWPRNEQFGLTSQVRRAVVSVPANIAEGNGRTGSREFLHHLSMARGSLLETETHLQLAARLGYVSEDDVAPLLARSAILDRRLRALITSLRNRLAG